MNRHQAAPVQAPPQRPAAVGLLQRTCDCGQHTAGGGECGPCASKRKALQRAAMNRDPVGIAPPVVNRVLRSPGVPLDRATRSFFEPRFGEHAGRITAHPAVPATSGLVVGPAGGEHELEADAVADRVLRGSAGGAAAAGFDFSHVRIHTGPEAAESARAVNARAYTVGSDIVFAEGEYAPQTPAGRRLLAHELAHTIQQAGGRAARAQLQRTIGDGHDLQAARFSGDVVLEACFDDEQLLRAGSRGPAVEKIQQALIDAGHPLPLFGADGIFGSETRSALQDFQRSRGLDDDGIVGPLTMGALDAEFTARPPAPAPPAPAPPAPAPPGPPPAVTTITSETVEPVPAPRDRTTIGVGEKVTLTHSAGSVPWSTTAGTCSPAVGPTTTFTAPDTAQTVTVTGGSLAKIYTVLAPANVHMDRVPGTLRHCVNRPDSGIEAQPFLLPDTVNFEAVIYRELDARAVASGTYSCLTGRGHLKGRPRELLMLTTVVAGKGTQAILTDCIYSGDCGTKAPFTPGSISFDIQYEYKIGTGPFHAIAKTVSQVSTLAADASSLSSEKAGARGDTTVAAPTSTIANCPGDPCT